VDPFEWHCPFCSAKQIVTEDTTSDGLVHLRMGRSRYGQVGIWWRGIRCVNPECNDVALVVSLDELSHEGGWSTKRELERWELRPRSRAKPQPEYIPAPLVQDYIEACLIRHDSPKASATLSRRCLQGMIRDFCGIAEPTLAAEIRELKQRVDSGNAPKGVEAETIDAIDAVRSIGNIGAHMEKDINVIVDVDAGEAEALTDLIELLFEEWYVARRARQDKLAKITAIADAKKAAKGSVPAASA
jgi:hypothetical protein